MRVVGMVGDSGDGYKLRGGEAICLELDWLR